MPATDVSPAKVTGLAIANRGRVIWSDDRLYVFRTQEDFDVFDAPNPPKRLPKDSRGGTWYHSEGLDIEWRSAGCSCSCAICKVPKTTLLAAAA